MNEYTHINVKNLSEHRTDIRVADAPFNGFSVGHTLNAPSLRVDLQWYRDRYPRYRFEIMDGAIVQWLTSHLLNYKVVAIPKDGYTSDDLKYKDTLRLLQQAAEQGDVYAQRQIDAWNSRNND